MSIESLNALRENIQKVFIGHPDSADRLLVCLLAHTAFFTAFAYAFATDDSTRVWHVGVWEFGGFAILA